MTRRERFRLYAAEHFTAPDEPAAGRRHQRGVVERQTRRSRLASLARITPRHPLPACRRDAAPALRVVVPVQRTCSDRPGTSVG